MSHEATRTGAPAVAVDVGAALARTRGGVAFVLRARGDRLEQFERVGPVHHEPLKVLRVLLRRRRSTAGWADRVDEVAASMVLRRLRPTHLVLNSVKAANYLRPALRRRIPVVLYAHETDPMLGEVLGRYLHPGQGQRIELLACGEATRVDLAEAAGVAPDTIAVLPPRPPAPPPARPGPALGDRLRIGAAGLPNRGKGVDLFIRLADALAESYPAEALEFVWFGGTAPADMDPGHVAFLGSVEDPYTVLTGLDVYVHPTREDAAPIRLSEAMLAGLPVVATAVGDIPSMLGDTGLLVGSEDLPALHEAVSRLLADAAARSELGRAARDRASARAAAIDVEARINEAVERSVRRAAASGAD